MRFLSDLLTGLFKWGVDQVGRIVNNASATMLLVLGVFMGSVVLPVSWLFKWATGGVNKVNEVLIWIGGQVDKLQLDRFAELWSGLGGFLSQVEAVFPLSFLFKCAGIMIAIRIAILGLRLALRFIPFLK